MRGEFKRFEAAGRTITLLSFRVRNLSMRPIIREIKTPLEGWSETTPVTHLMASEAWQMLKYRMRGGGSPAGIKLRCGVITAEGS